MSNWRNEVDEGERFRFGANWSRYQQRIDASMVAESERSLREALGVDTLVGQRFLDVGSGSGLHSLAARNLGATVHSFDYDEDSVAATSALKARFRPDDAAWTIERGSALDEAYLDSLGKYDVVYSWGVLHHTGDMWRALELVDRPLAPGGSLFLALYNDQGGASRRWHHIKRTYASAGPIGQTLITLGIGAFFEGRSAAIAGLRGQNPLPFGRWADKKKQRGMSPWTDLVDWVGGYPFEVAAPEEVFRFFRERGYRLEHLVTCGAGRGCNEYVFVGALPERLDARTSE